MLAGNIPTAIPFTEIGCVITGLRTEPNNGIVIRSPIPDVKILNCLR